MTASTVSPVRKSKGKAPSRQESALNRAVLILDATERLMISEGYAAVTTRRIAGMLGLTAPRVHCFYATTEELLVATLRRAMVRYDERLRRALESDRSLHALWNLNSDPHCQALAVQFMALANHRKAIRAEIRAHDERERKTQAEVIASFLAGEETGFDNYSPMFAAMLLKQISRGLVLEGTLGISCGHAETRAFVKRLLGRLEKKRAAGTNRRAGSLIQ